MLVKKAYEKESYSAFEYVDDYCILNEFLKENGVKEVFICGIALNYCVKATAEDAVKHGYTTIVLENLCRSIWRLIFYFFFFFFIIFIRVSYFYKVAVFLYVKDLVYS